VPDVDSSLLDPRRTWQDDQAYEEQMRELVGKFVDNFKKFEGVDRAIVEAGPQLD
jgi:phosphoenolpyruvate carboxykinase (ATP)